VLVLKNISDAYANYCMFKCGLQFKAANNRIHTEIEI